MKTYSLTIPSKRKNLSKVEEFIMNLKSECELDEDHFHNLLTAVTEVVLNAIVHGNKENEKKNVQIDVILNDELIQVKIQDEGNGVSSEKIVNPNLPEDPLDISGRGLYIVKALVSDIECSKNQKGFCCILKMDK